MIQEELSKIIDNSRIKENELMSKHTSFKIGGIADFYIEINTIEEFLNIKKFVKEKNIPFFIIGNGTNLLVLDKGIRGIVAKLNFNKIEIDEIKNTVKVSADYPISKLSRLLSKKSYEGMEFLCGIPGSVGGAIYMNAGAYGSEIKDILISATILDSNGDIRVLNNSDLNLEYRSSIFKSNDWIILEAVFKIQKGNLEKINSKIDEFTNKRKNSQPIEFPSAGSTFKRLEDIPVAKMIDDCGLKGFSIGGAQVSEKHAGFIINKNNATAKDVLKLIDYVSEKVYQRFNKKIELEVIVIGDQL